MATKQAIISQNDYGIALDIGIYDQSQTPFVDFDLEDIEIYVIDPNGEVLPVTDFYKLGYADLTHHVIAILKEEHTATVGNHGLYVRYQEALMKVTTTKAWNYYVLSEFGL